MRVSENETISNNFLSNMSPSDNLGFDFDSLVDYVHEFSFRFHTDYEQLIFLNSIESKSSGYGSIPTKFIKRVRYYRNIAFFVTCIKYSPLLFPMFENLEKYFLYPKMSITLLIGQLPYCLSYPKFLKMFPKMLDQYRRVSF